MSDSDGNSAKTKNSPEERQLAFKIRGRHIRISEYPARFVPMRIVQLHTHVPLIRLASAPLPPVEQEPDIVQLLQ